MTNAGSPNLFLTDRKYLRHLGSFAHCQFGGLRSQAFAEHKENKSGQKKPRAGRADAGQSSALGLGGKLSAPNNPNRLAAVLFRSKTIFLKNYPVHESVHTNSHRRNVKYSLLLRRLPSSRPTVPTQ
jgi:hypothetical protein